MSNPDTYYNRSEVSNSDLTALKNLLHPVPMPPGVKEAAFRFGSLVDAIITEPERVNYYRLTVDQPCKRLQDGTCPGHAECSRLMGDCHHEQYTDDEFRHAKEMYRSLRMFARHDPFLARVLEQAETQRVSVNSSQLFEYGGFEFALPTRCKWDWWLPRFRFGGDLKTTSASTQHEFDEAMDFFDWDRSRAWYMDIERTDCDFIYAISKRNCNVFTTRIRRDDPVYLRGRAKYEELAFHYWCLAL